MANMMDFLANYIREELPTAMYEQWPIEMPLAENIEISYDNVKRGIGKNWIVEHMFDVGVGGLFQYANPMGIGTTSLTGGRAGMFALGTAASDRAPYPRAADSAFAGNMLRQLVMHKITGNFPIPVTWLQADALDATNIKQIPRHIKSVAKSYAKMEAISFFAHSVADAGGFDVDVMGRISTITEVSTTNYVDIVLNKTYGTVHNFRPGDRLDIVADSGAGVIQTGVATNGTDVRNYAATNVYVELTVTAVAPLTNTVRVVGLNSSTGAVAAYSAGDWGSGQAAATGDWIVLRKCSTYIAGTRPMLTWGINDWTKSSGTLMSSSASEVALNLTDYPDFASQVTAINGPFTEDVANMQVGKFAEAYPSVGLETIITTMGVQLKAIEQSAYNNNRFNYDRQGKTLNMALGWDKMTYSFGGKTFRFYVSPYCLANTMYIIKMGEGNYKRYSPPRITAVGGQQPVNDLEFLGTLVTPNNIFMHVFDAAGDPQDYLQAPCWLHRLIVPVDVRGIKLTGVTEKW